MDEKLDKKPEIKSETRTVSDLLQITDIALDSYDDIFSDFDPSPYTTRLLSEDFIKELNRRYSETGKGEFVVNLSLPKSLRFEKTELLVKKRIKDHFKSHLKTIEKIIKEKKKRGVIRIVIGILISIPIFILPQLEFLPVLTALSVLMWYALWSGFELVFEASARIERKKVFYEKFLRADYKFVSQEDVIQSLQGLTINPKEDLKSRGNS